MLNEKTPLKLLPYQTSKGRIFKMYPAHPDGNLRLLIQEIQIQSNPYISEYVVRQQQKVNHGDWVKLLEVIDFPKGYKKSFD